MSNTIQIKSFVLYVHSPEGTGLVSRDGSDDYIFPFQEAKEKAEDMRAAFPDATYTIFQMVRVDA